MHKQYMGRKSREYTYYHYKEEIQKTHLKLHEEEMREPARTHTAAPKETPIGHTHL